MSGGAMHAMFIPWRSLSRTASLYRLSYHSWSRISPGPSQWKAIATCPHTTTALIPRHHRAFHSSTPRQETINDQDHTDSAQSSESASPSSSPSSLPSYDAPAPCGPPYQILFCGSDDFSLQTLNAIHAAPELWESIAVITPPEANQTWAVNKNKQSPVKAWALENSIPHATYVKSTKTGVDEEDMISKPLINESMPPPFTKFLDRPKNGLLLTASFGSMIDDQTLRLFTGNSPSQALNVHPSLLPKLRGAAPIQWAIARRHKTIGTSVQQLSEGCFDRGRILSSESTPMPRDASSEGLMPAMALLSAKVTVETLRQLPAKHRLSWEQDDSKASYAPKLQADKHLVIDWERHSALDIEARWRAFRYLGDPITFLHGLPPIRPRVTHPPPAQMFFEDIHLVDRSTSVYDNTASRLAGTTPNPGRARLTWWKGQGNALVIDCLSDQEKKAFQGKSYDLGIPSLNHDTDCPKEFSRRLEKLTDEAEPYLPAILVTKVRRLNRSHWALRTWWKDNSQCKDHNNFMRFGPPDSPEEKELREEHNERYRVLRNQKDDEEKERRRIYRLSEKFKRVVMAEEARLPRSQRQAYGESYGRQKYR